MSYRLQVTFVSNICCNFVSVYHIDNEVAFVFHRVSEVVFVFHNGIEVVLNFLHRVTLFLFII